MRSFIISILCLVLLLGVWTVYDNYSDDKLHGYIDQVEYSILPAVESEYWEGASKEFDNLSNDWHNYKRRAAFFYDTALINEVDYTIARAKYYIKAADLSNTSGELSSLMDQLAFLHFNESISPENIF